MKVFDPKQFMIFLMIVSFVIGVLIGSSLNAHADRLTQKRNCQPNHLCVFPGDYMKYQTQAVYGNGNLTYIFQDFVSDHEIKVQVTFLPDTGEKFTWNRVIDLNTGLLEKKYQNDYSSMSYNDIPYSLFNVSSINLSYDQLNNVKITEGKHSGWYGGHLERDTVFFKNDFPDKKVDVYIDKQTRIIIYSSWIRLGDYVSNLSVLTETNVPELLESQQNQISNQSQNTTQSQSTPEFGTLSGIVAAISIIGVLIILRTKNKF